MASEPGDWSVLIEGGQLDKLRTLLFSETTLEALRVRLAWRCMRSGERVLGISAAPPPMDEQDSAGLRERPLRGRKGR